MGRTSAKRGKQGGNVRNSKALFLAPNFAQVVLADKVRYPSASPSSSTDLTFPHSIENIIKIYRCGFIR